jgi:O-antigen/teichoic acid export membrane protein
MIKKILNNKKTKSMFIYSISYALNKASMYLLLPLYTRVLSVELFGKYEFLNTFFSFLLPLGLFGLNSAVLRFYKINKKNYNNKVFKIVGDVYRYSIIFYIVSGSLIYFIESNIFNGSILILIFFVSRLIIEGTDKIFKNRIRMDEQEKKYLLLDITKFISSILLSVILLKIMDDKFMAIFLSISYSSILSFFYYFKKYIRISENDNVKLRKEILSYSYPLTFNSVANWIFLLSDKILINIYLGYSALGLYSAGFKLGSLAQFLTFGFGLMWPKWALEIKGKKNTGEKIEKILSKVLFLFITLFILLFSILKFIYPYFYEDVYQESFKIVPIIILSFLLLGIDMVTAIGIFYEKKSFYTLITTAAAAILNIILNVIFLDKIGYIFAAFSTYISNLFLLLFRGFISYKLFKIKYKTRTILLFVLLNLIVLIMR